MSRLARTSVGLFLLAVTAGVWFASRPARAQAPGQAAAAAVGPRYEIRTLSTDGWVILDTESGAFEVWGWVPRGPAYQVQRGTFGTTALTTRLVPAPRAKP